MRNSSPLAALSVNSGDALLIDQLREAFTVLSSFPAVRIEAQTPTGANAIIKEGTPSREILSFEIEDGFAGVLRVSAPAASATELDLVKVTVRAVLEKLEVERREELLLKELSANWESLEVLYDISTDVLRFGNIANALKRLADRFSSLQDGLEACVFVTRSERLVPLAASHTLPQIIGWADLGPMEKAIRSGQPVLINSPQWWEHSEDLSWNCATSIAASPITSRQQKVIGALVVWRCDTRFAFDSPFSRFLEAIAYQASMLLESDRLNRTMRENERLAQEIEIASSIQQTLLCGRARQHLPSLEVAAFSLASQGIDGDFHDFLEHENTLDVIVGDVMGKGVAAALLGAAAKNQFLRAITNLAIQTGGAPSPVAIVQRAASRLEEQLLSLERFITLCYARFDVGRGCVEFVDCGHTGILVHRKQTGETFFLRGDDLPLGVVLNEKPVQHTAPLMPGDTFLLFSDGVTESRNAEGEIFGDGRLVESVETWSSLGPTLLLQQIQNLTEDFRAGERQKDDFTCIAIRIKAGPEDSLASHSNSEFPCDLDQISALREWLANVVEKLDEADIARIETAVTEVFVNCVIHGSANGCHGPVHVEVSSFETHLKIDIRHEGPAFDPLSIPPPSFDGSRDGGFGTFIIMRLADELIYQRNGEINTITFSILRK